MKRSHELYVISMVLIIFAAVVICKTFAWDFADISGESQTALQTDASQKQISSYAVNINEADRFELLGVKGITEKMADGIIEYRTKNGRFADTSELLEVEGIGPVTYERIKPYIAV